jgi:hypothetical protein
LVILCRNACALVFVVGLLLAENGISVFMHGAWVIVQAGSIRRRLKYLDWNMQALLNKPNNSEQQHFSYHRWSILLASAEIIELRPIRFKITTILGTLLNPFNGYSIQGIFHRAIAGTPTSSSNIATAPCGSIKKGGR